MSDAPRVAVVIPTHYRNDRLRMAIESVRAQTYDPVEILVVDDSGEYHAESVAEAYDVPYVGFDENRGANAARTVGARETGGAYIQYLDDDDRLHPRKLERQVELLESDPAVGVAYCGMQFETGGTVLPDESVRGDVLEEALAFELYPCLTTTMLAERAVVEDALPWTNRPGADDFCRMIELAKRTGFGFVDESLVVRGRIDDSRGQSMGVYHGRMEVLREYSHLYEEFPSSVRNRALTDTHEFRARTLLREGRWTVDTPIAFAKAAAYGRDPKLAGLAAASTLGPAGVRLATTVYGTVL